jgi:selenocysteine lyase/cysteine desulfurase
VSLTVHVAGGGRLSAAYPVYNDMQDIDKLLRVLSEIAQT